MKLSPLAFQRLRDLVHQACGLALGDDKSYLVEHRLEPLVRQRGLASFDELYEVLDREARSQGGTQAIIEALTTRETSFFRDVHPFETLRLQVLPLWRSATGRGARPIRIWSAGCSTGQEPYSLAMLVREQQSADSRGNGPLDRTTILATDVCNSALDTARRGVYEPRDVARGVAASQLNRFFERHGPAWRIRADVGRMVEFERLNLVEPFTRHETFDLIACRNVLIYFDEPTRRRVCEAFQNLLADDGWLLLGAAENLYGISNAFDSVRFGDTLLYRKRT